MKRYLDHGRAVVIGYFCAIIAAGIGYVFLLALAINLAGSIENPSDMPPLAQFGSLVMFGLMVTSFIGVLAVPSFVVAAIVIIALDRRDIVSHIIAGVAVSVVTVMLVANRVLFMEEVKVDWLSLSAGAVGGIAYWAVSRVFGPKPAVAA